MSAMYQFCNTRFQNQHANESLDSDNDGIGDNYDKCDDTKTGDNIDLEGCVIVSTSSTSSNQNLVITAGVSVLILIIISFFF